MVIGSMVDGDGNVTKISSLFYIAEDPGYLAYSTYACRKRHTSCRNDEEDRGRGQKAKSQYTCMCFGSDIVSRLEENVHRIHHFHGAVVIRKLASTFFKASN